MPGRAVLSVRFAQVPSMAGNLIRRIGPTTVGIGEAIYPRLPWTTTRRDIIWDVGAPGRMINREAAAVTDGKGAKEEEE